MKKQVLQNYIEQIDAVRFLDSSKMLKLSRQMLNEAKKDKDVYAQAYASYIYLEASYRLGKLDEKMLSIAVNALQMARDCNAYDLECKILNMLGIFFLNQGDNIAALEYYQMAMDIAKKRHYYGRVRVMMNNIGDMFIHLHQYEEALPYLERCLEQSIELYEKGLRTGKAEIGIHNINVAILNMATCYYGLGNYEESLRMLDSLYKDREGVEESYYGSGKEALLALIYLKTGRMAEAEPHIENVIQAAEEKRETIEMAEDYIRIAEALLETDKMEQAERMLKAIYVIAEELNFSTVWCHYYEAAVAYAKKTQDTQALLATYDRYMYEQKRREAFLDKQQMRSVKNRQTLNTALKKQKQAEEAKISLKHLSEHDPLTGLYNRYVLNREADRWWKKAMEKGNSVGAVMMDIDYFKQYNDTYGHLEGDACIKRVGEIIYECVGNKGTVVRYGGDEFFILLQGLRTEDIIGISKTINERLLEEKILHEKSLVSPYVTVSQGIVNGIPEEGQSMVDLTHLADNALYRAKEKKRGSIGVYENKSYRVIIR